MVCFGRGRLGARRRRASAAHGGSGHAGAGLPPQLRQPNTALVLIFVIGLIFDLVLTVLVLTFILGSIIVSLLHLLRISIEIDF